MTDPKMSIDDAYTAMKQAEGNLLTAQAAEGSAQAALTAAQTMVTAANDGMHAALVAFKAAGDDLIAATQNAEANLPADPEAPAAPAPAAAPAQN